MDGELVMCSVENNNNNKITRKQQQNNNKISKQCVYLKQVFTLTFVSVSCIILQLYINQLQIPNNYFTHTNRHTSIETCEVNF